MRLKTLSALFVLGSVVPVAAQITVIQGSDQVSTSRTVINNNFSYLQGIKTAKYSGAGSPGTITGSVFGDFYLNTSNNGSYQCFASPGPCTAVASGNWVQINIGLVTSVFGRTGAVTAQSGDYSVGQVTGAAGSGSCGANQVSIATTSGGVTCVALVLASAYFANQGIATTVLHGNPAGNPSWATITLTTDVGGILPVANGGTGTATPGLIAGTNITITGSWPNQTINSSAGGTVNSVNPGTGTTVTGTATNPVVNVDGTYVPFLGANNAYSGLNNMTQQIITKAIPYTLTSADFDVLCDTATAAGPLTMTLPLAPITGQVYTIKNLGTSLCTVAGNGKNIDGSASYTGLATTGNDVGLHYDGVQWRTKWVPGGGTSVSVSGPYLVIGATKYITPFMYPAVIPPTLSFLNTQGAATQTVNADGSITFKGATAAGDNILTLGSTIGANTTLTVAFSLNNWDINGIARSGVVFRESATGKLETLEITSSSGPSQTAVNSNYFSNQTTYGGTTLLSGLNWWGPAPVYWAKIAKTGGNLTFQFSTDGISYPTALSQAQNAVFTTAPDQWGVFVSSSNTTPTFMQILSYQVQ